MRTKSPRGYRRTSRTSSSAMSIWTSPVCRFSARRRLLLCPRPGCRLSVANWLARGTLPVSVEATNRRWRPSRRPASKKRKRRMWLFLCAKLRRNSRPKRIWISTVGWPGNILSSSLKTDPDRRRLRISMCSQYSLNQNDKLLNNSSICWRTRHFRVAVCQRRVEEQTNLFGRFVSERQRFGSGRTKRAARRNLREQMDAKTTPSPVERTEATQKGATAFEKYGRP